MHLELQIRTWRNKADGAEDVPVDEGSDGDDVEDAEAHHHLHHGVQRAPDRAFRDLNDVNRRAQDEAAAAETCIDKQNMSAGTGYDAGPGYEAGTGYDEVLVIMQSLGVMRTIN